MAGTHLPFSQCQCAQRAGPVAVVAQLHMHQLDGRVAVRKKSSFGVQLVVFAFKNTVTLAVPHAVRWHGLIGIGSWRDRAALVAGRQR